MVLWNLFWLCELFFKAQKSVLFYHKWQEKCLISIYFIKAAWRVLQKWAHNLKTSVFWSIHEIRHYVQQDCDGNVMSLCTAGDYDHLWIQKWILFFEMKSCVS